jgi:tetratricopeptide (TPR) repeat protein
MLIRADEAPSSGAAQHQQQGHAYGLRGDLIQALLEFDLAIEANPQDSDAHFWRAITLQRLGDHRQALSDLRQAQDLNGANVEILVEYGNVYLALNQWQLAIAQYDLALQTDPQLAQAHHNRGVAYERLGQPTIARTCYEQAILLNPHAPESYLGLAVACEQMDDRTQATSAYQMVIEAAGQGTLADQARDRLQRLANQT